MANQTDGAQGLEGAIAIIAVAGRFPGAGDTDAFWRNLRSGTESIRFFTPEELEAEGVDAALVRDPRYVAARGWLEGVDLFDAPFFNFSPRDAALLDPQHRLLLEVAWEALENGGYDPDRFDGRVGVYAGCAMSTYLIFNVLGGRDPAEVLDLPAWLANGGDFLSTRVSYKLNLQGPSVSVGTGCSTSLVAIHMACQSLLAGECEMALAGGVAAGTRQARGYLYADGGIMSPDGHCRAFDAASRGAVAGSGVGVVALRRLEDALADGDPIRAVIRGSAINNDGGQKVSYTAPRAQGQADVIVEAMEVAGVPPESIGYVEGHGSGTVLGDPIEVEALTRAFRTRTQRRQFCAIGSVKTNVGHLDTAAGVAGLIKTVLGLEHGEIPPSLHFQEPNPQIDFAGSPFFVADRLLPWPSADGTPRRAGVSSFGIGGTNAHVVLEEAPPAEPSDPGLPWQLVAVSARTATALETATDNLASHLMEHPELPLADAAYTLLQGRRGWEHRRVVVCADSADAASALATRDPARVFTRVAEAGHRPVAFLFSGLGDQYPGMTRGVYDTVPAYRQAVDRCIRVARERLGMDLGAALLSAEEPQAERGGLDMRRMMARAPEGPRFASAELAHAAVFTVEYALAQLWMSWGVRPEAMIGHSLGEYAAACVAGVFEVEDALELVVRRARLIDTLPAGGMLAVPLAEAEVAALLPDGVDVAAANAPGLTVVSGSTAGIEEMERVLEARGVISRRVATTRPFHSRQMSPAADEMARLVAAVPRRAPSIPFLSNVTGDWITPEEATDPAYWARHLCSTVRFADGVGRLLDEPRTVLLEVGPGQTLGSFARQCAAGRGAERPVVPSVRSDYNVRPDLAFLLEAAGTLWTAGVEVKWSALFEGQHRRRVRLPTYPFERQRYWIDPAPSATQAPPLSILPEAGPQLVAVVTEPAQLHPRTEFAREYVAPANETEELLASIWQESLGIQQIGTRDDFFELGGHSLMGAQIIARARETFQVELPLAALFGASTVELMAVAIENELIAQIEAMTDAEAAELL